MQQQQEQQDDKEYWDVQEEKWQTIRLAMRVVREGLFSFLIFCILAITAYDYGKRNQLDKLLFGLMGDEAPAETTAPSRSTGPVELTPPEELFAESAPAPRQGNWKDTAQPIGFLVGVVVLWFRKRIVSFTKNLFKKE